MQIRMGRLQEESLLMTAALMGVLQAKRSVMPGLLSIKRPEKKLRDLFRRLSEENCGSVLSRQ